MVGLVLLCYLTAIVGAKRVLHYSLREGPQHFDDFIQNHNKSYANDEEKAIRYQIFLQNLDEINSLNAKYEYTEFGVNKFTDLTTEEFVTRHTCYKSSNILQNRLCETITPESINKYEELDVPTEFDWRTKNVVSRIKDQDGCGACWAFSVIGNVESVYAIKTGQLLELSEQQLVDCDKSDHGCSGGLPERALVYLTSRGAMSSTSYPYEAADRTCRYEAAKIAVNVTGCIELAKGTEDFIAEQLIKIGPLSIAIDASKLHHYKSGVLHGDWCKLNDLNHAVLIVGYGVDSASGLKYWLVKNSWGESKGEKGYFRMQRGMNCLGLLDDSQYSAIIG